MVCSFEAGLIRPFTVHNEKKINKYDAATVEAEEFQNPRSTQNDSKLWKTKANPQKRRRMGLMSVFFVKRTRDDEVKSVK